MKAVLIHSHNPVDSSCRCPTNGISFDLGRCFPYTSASPSLDEAMAAGSVLDKALLGLFADEVASTEILMEASGDTVLARI